MYYGGSGSKLPSGFSHLRAARAPFVASFACFRTACGRCFNPYPLFTISCYIINMDNKLILDIIGYIGSAFVLASFLMATVKKLRIINSIGSIVTIVYGVLIQAYPTVFMNACLLLINVYYLVKMFRYKEEFHIVEAKIDDGSVKFFLHQNKDDISVFFPEFSDTAAGINYTRLIYCQNKIVGLCVGKRDGDTLAIYLDYTTKEYRDYSVGKYLFAVLPSEGISTIELTQKTKHHYQYLVKMGFVRDGDRFIKRM